MAVSAKLSLWQQKLPTRSIIFTANATTQSVNAYAIVVYEIWPNLVKFRIWSSKMVL